MKKQVIFAITILAIGLFSFLILTNQALFHKITGLGTSPQTYNVSIAVTGTTAVKIVYISPITGYSSTESNPTTITFNTYLEDDDGVDDINDSSVKANFTVHVRSNLVRSNDSCLFVNDISGTNQANFSCTITMWYWDVNTDWNVTVTGNDLGNTTYIVNDSTSFTYGLTTAIVVAPDQLGWAAVASSDQFKNASSSLLINNTGNKNITAGGISIKGINLCDEDCSDNIPAANFSVGLNDSTTCSGGKHLVNNSAEAISGSIIEAGNLTVGSGTGQEQLYFCLRQVPAGIPTQTYSTEQAGSWQVSV